MSEDTRCIVVQLSTFIVDHHAWLLTYSLSI